MVGHKVQLIGGCLAKYSHITINDIKHSKTKVLTPQSNGICERFHKTILQEFCQVIFRKKIYSDLETLQENLDEWIKYYNNEQTYQGKNVFRKNTDGNMFGGKKIWQEKLLNQN